MRSTFGFLFLFLFSLPAFSAGAGNWGLGAWGALTTTSQGDMGDLQKRDNQRSGVSTPAFGNAIEAGGLIHRRLNNSSVALQLRPSYFTQSASASGGNAPNNGTYKYDVTGFIIMPLIRLYILESKSTMLYLQGGVGWGMETTKIQEAGYSVTASGDDWGFQGGIGVEFCLGAGTHCFFTEGNLRYLYIERNLVSDSSGTPPTGPSGISSAIKGQELEIDGKDLGVSMSGVQALLGYIFHF